MADQQETAFRLPTNLGRVEMVRAGRRSGKRPLPNASWLVPGLCQRVLPPHRVLRVLVHMNRHCPRCCTLVLSKASCSSTLPAVSASWRRP